MMEYQEMLHRCFRCGWCKLPTDFSGINCPAYLLNRFESFAAGGRLWLIRAWLEGEVETSDRFLEIVYSCATCKNCVEACGIPGIKDFLVDMVVAAREEIVNRGVLPGGVKDYFRNIYNWGNPYKRPREERAAWADGFDVPSYTDQEFLLYVGDAGSFDETGIKMARAAAQLFNRLGVSYGILGVREISDGNEVLTLGERGLFDYLAEENIRIFGELGVRKVITLSPHSYNSFLNYFPEDGRSFDVFHYTQILSGIAQKGMSLKNFLRRVTYHDPCYLGRWNAEYWPPRIVLRAIPGLEVVEMDRSMGTALCCGGGGGNFFSGILGSGDTSSARMRIRDALETGADTLVVSCPLCFKMLDDGIKDEGVGDRLRVLDISGLLLEALKG